MIEWRRHIHENPELSNREYETAKYIAAHLEELGLKVQTGVAHTGVVAVLEGGKPGPVVGLRADMDALPILEDTGVKLSGRVPQMMYRAYTTGENARRWEGAEATEDPIFCVNTQTKFRISHLTGNGIEMRPCEGQNEAMKRFIWAPTLDRQVQIGRVNF